MNLPKKNKFRVFVLFGILSGFRDTGGWGKMYGHPVDRVEVTVNLHHKSSRLYERLENNTICIMQCYLIK